MGQLGDVEGNIWKFFLKKKVIDILDRFSVRENLEILKTAQGTI